MCKLNHSSFLFVIRVPKEQSAFTYFQLEANENLCFYSTLKESLGMSYRDIQIEGSMDFRKEVLRILQLLAEKFPMDFLKIEPS